MNTRFASQSLIALALTAVSLLNGCTQQSAGPAPAYVTTSSAPAAVGPQVVPAPPEPVQQLLPVNAAPPVASAAPVVPSLIISNAPPPALAAESALPANLRISKPLNEVIRLAQSGVDETVILTFITNSPAIFTLGAEEIVYLNDLGISSSVITGMMQRDQALRTAWANAANVPVTAITNAEPIATAPTYVNTPQVSPAPEAQPAYISNDYFQDALSPYGSWVEVDGYGRCWRPTVSITSSSWQPYRDRGRWVHTDTGWYWMSDYSWGSVAFHYGRWFSHPRWGWCWWPDTTWGASWVTWRYDNDNCGWAPLPPRSYYRSGVGFVYRDRNVGVNFDFELGVGAFTFVPWGRFCDSRPYQYYLPRPRSVAIYNQTTVINNVVIGNNNTVINRGISTDRVREHTRTEVRTVTLREENSRSIIPRQEHFERDGRTLVVQRPQPAPSAIGLARSTSDRDPSRNDSNQRGDFRRPDRSTTPTPNNPAPVVIAPVIPAAPRNEPARLPERQQRNEAVSNPRIPESRATGERLPGRELKKEEASANLNPSPAPTVRAPELRSTPTPVRTPTPIFSKPIVIETPAYTPTRSVVGGLPPESNPNINRPTRSTTRDNSVWSSPASQPNPVGSAPNYNPAPRRNRSVAEQTPQAQDSQPASVAPTYNRPNAEVRREERALRNDTSERTPRVRSEERSVVPSYTPPAFTPAPAPAARPSYTPPAAPAPAPTPRVESPAAPARSEAPRSETRSEPRSESRPDSGRNPRNR